MPPISMPKNFYTWSRWRLGRKEFEAFGPGNMKVRPNVGYGARGQKPIPKEWWDEFKKRFVPAPTTGSIPGTPTFFDLLDGILLRVPGGDVEHFDTHVFKWQALDLNAGPEYVWDHQRDMAKYNDTLTVPWHHVRAVEHINRLIEVAWEWDSPGLLLNLEKEAETTLSPALVASKLAVYQKPVAIICVNWLYNSVNWKPLNVYPMYLEIFPQEAESAKDQEGCLQWGMKQLGSQRVYPCYGAHWGAKPQWYNMKRRHALYTQNDIGVDLVPWRV